MFELNSKNIIRMTRSDTAAFSVKIDPPPTSNEDMLTFTVKEDVDDVKPALQVKTNLFTEDGYAVIVISSKDSNIRAGDYYYDIQIDYADGSRYTLVWPTKFKIVDQITTNKNSE